MRRRVRGAAGDGTGSVNKVRWLLWGWRTEARDKASAERWDPLIAVEMTGVPRYDLVPRSVVAFWLAMSTLLIPLSLLVLVGCEDDAHNNPRGRGDAPVGPIDDTPAEVINFPDKFSNVATKCDGHGHRLYVTTQNENGKQLSVIADPTCGGAVG
jgi:hypothetical protein